MNAVFHKRMLCTCVALLLIDIIGCNLTNVKVSGVWVGSLGFFLLAVAVLPLLAYWRETGRLYSFDATLTICWVVSVKVLIAYPIAIAARLGMGMSLWDDRLAQLDQVLGINIAQLSAWASKHWIGQTANASYSLLPDFVFAAVLLPIIARRVNLTQRFLTANIVAFAISLPIFALMPAVGPWYGLHFLPSDSQLACQSAFLLARQPVPSSFEFAGIICFPSFHAIWSILCVYPLWQMRWLRIPALLFSSLILFSAVSTGWHYFVDIVAGAAIAAASILIASLLQESGETVVAPNVVAVSDLVELNGVAAK